MNFALVRRMALVFAVSGLLGASCSNAQDQQHGRKYTPPPATAHIVVTVVKKFNDKPMDGVAVMFRARKNGHETGNMEVKTNSQGKAIIDLIEAGSRVRVQVFALGYATHGEEFGVTEEDKDVLVKMERPRAQVSSYKENTEESAPLKPGLQEHVVPKRVVPAPASSTPQQ
ncbi:MAG: hypothetical protein ABI142_05485 [Bryocella sp.]